MKLREYLDSFKDFDPELEIWQFRNEGSYKLKRIFEVCTFRFIRNSNEISPEYTSEKSEDYNKKIIVLY